jgi:hypothetical protein
MHLCKRYQINKKTEKEKRKEIRKEKRAVGVDFGPAAKAALAHYHLNPKGYPALSPSRRQVDPTRRVLLPLAGGLPAPDASSTVDLLPSPKP